MFKCFERENSEFAHLREGRSPAASRLDVCRLVRPGAALETGTELRHVTGAKVRVEYTNAGGTAEGLPFVPGFSG